jgi:flavin reductase (DIM6/NTAB) family NADH-FMN oxidoreductase RutF
MDATGDAVDTFTSLMGELDYPMFIVTTTSSDGERAGCMVGFATQISIRPPRFLVGLSDKNRTYRVAQRADHLAVHFIPADGQDLAELFGSETGDEVDKFAHCAWHEGPARLPILDDLPNWFAGRILARVDGGDHEAMILEPIAAEREAEEEELTFHRAKWIEPGHAP